MYFLNYFKTWVGIFNHVNTGVGCIRRRFIAVGVFRRMLKYAAVENQPAQGRSRDHLQDDERPIFDKFADSQFVESLVKYLSLEENKGKDRFHAKYFTLFKVDYSILCCVILNKSHAWYAHGLL